jgi:uncharacterized protein (DUF608 family)
MENTALLDADGDGLPDRDTRRNTYDAWSFFGTPSYIASLWLSALLAAARLAEDLGRKAQAAQWRKVLRRGIASFEGRPGRSPGTPPRAARSRGVAPAYSLWVDGKDRDECCMTDQIDGEWFTSLIGLGGCLPRERIVAALGAVMRHNFSPEEGLRNATYPPRTKPRLSTYQNLQAMAPWTGIEYAIGSMMFDFGLVAEGWAVVRNIHERYLRAGRYWNHVECGDHYYRAMSIVGDPARRDRLQDRRAARRRHLRPGHRGRRPHGPVGFGDGVGHLPPHARRLRPLLRFGRDRNVGRGSAPAP